MDEQGGSVTIHISRKSLMRIVALGLIILCLFLLKSLVFVVLTSVVLASFIRIAAESFNRRFGLNRIISIVLIYLTTFLGFVAVFYFFVPVLVSEVSNILPVLSEHFPSGLPAIGNIDLNSLGQAGDAATLASPANLSELAPGLQAFVSAVANGFGSTLSVLFGGLLNVALVIIISFYLAVSRDGVESFLRIIAPIENEEYVIGLWKRSQRKIALWMQGQMILGLVVGFLTFLGLMLLGVQHTLLLALVAAVFELIPFGIFLAAVPAVTLAFGSGGLSLAIMVVALYIVIQQLEGYLIAPLVVHKVTGVSPLIVILSVLVGVTLAGFWGLILAVPVAVTILEYVNDLEKERLLKITHA